MEGLQVGARFLTNSVRMRDKFWRATIVAKTFAQKEKRGSFEASPLEPF
jgi:hypothetical protein